jgi:hypothetical protein
MEGFGTGPQQGGVGGALRRCGDGAPIGDGAQ